MPFAVKLQKNESITLSSTVLLNLTLTSITLDPSSKKAKLFIRSKEDQSLVLITILERQKAQSYSCSVQLVLGEETDELIVKEGDIHIIANVQSVGQEVSRIGPSSIKITRRAEGQHCISEKNKKNKTNSEDKASKKTERAAPKIPQGKLPQKLNLLEMMNNIADDEDEDSDDCYEAEEESESDSSSQESQKQEEASKLKKKISWAAMLHDANDSEEEDEEQYNQQSESSQKSEESEDEQLKNKPKKKSKVDQAQKIIEVRGEDRKEEQLKTVSTKPKIIVKSDSESSSSFEFQVPKELPSFVGKK